MTEVPHGSEVRHQDWGGEELLYLARGSRLLPGDPRSQALIQQWMFYEQNQVELSIGLPRVWKNSAEPGIWR